MNFQLYSTSYGKRYHSPFNPSNRESNRKHSEPQSKYQLGIKQEKVGQFILGKTLGKGTFGKVKLGVHSITGEKVKLY